MQIFYQLLRKPGTGLRCFFRLECGRLSLPGTIYERTSAPGGYYWRFAGSFPWDHEKTPPPFRYSHRGQEYGTVLFYGVPQGLTRYLYSYEPTQLRAYQNSPASRNCANCLYAQLESERWESWRERPSFQRYQEAPDSLFTCAVRGQALGGRPATPGISQYRYELRKDSCEAHTRRAYQVAVSPESRQGGAPERWVPAEDRRLGLLNPQAFWIQENNLYLPGDLTIPMIPAP